MQVVYRGYVDDPRNTDNAWMETTAFHFHCNDDCAKLLRLEAGDDAEHVSWIDIDTSSDAYISLYASHKDWVDQVAQDLRPHELARTSKLAQAQYGYKPRLLVPDGKVSWVVPFVGYAPAEWSPPSHKALANDPALNFGRGPSRGWMAGAPGMAGTSGVASRSAKCLLSRSNTASGADACSMALKSRRHSAPNTLGVPAAHTATASSSASSSASNSAAAAQQRLNRWAPGSSSSTLADGGKGKKAKRTSITQAALKTITSPMALRRGGSVGDLGEISSLGEQSAARRSSYGFDGDYGDEGSVGPADQLTYEAPVVFDKPEDPSNARPLNPRGRTGLAGRGCLPRFGPNHVCEAIITRFHPKGFTEESFVETVKEAQDRLSNVGGGSAPAPSAPAPSALAPSAVPVWGSVARGRGAAFGGDAGAGAIVERSQTSPQRDSAQRAADVEQRRSSTATQPRSSRFSGAASSGRDSERASQRRGSADTRTSRLTRNMSIAGLPILPGLSDSSNWRGVKAKLSTGTRALKVKASTDHIHELEVLAFPHVDADGEESFHVIPPNTFDKAGVLVGSAMRSELLSEVRAA